MTCANALPLRYIGSAGWSLPRAVHSEFPESGSHLTRYSARFNATEINSSFHRPHRRSTYERWAASVPPEFAFSVKLPRPITHELRLEGVLGALDEFSEAVSGLGPKLRCVLIQLPPSLAFDEPAADGFLDAFRLHFAAAAVIEARHASWFTEAAADTLRRHRIGRVHADPAVLPEPIQQTAAVSYYRMHGSPRMYYSPYESVALESLAEALMASAARAEPTWCIFDNTAHGHATANALALQRLLSTLPIPAPR